VWPIVSVITNIGCKPYYVHRYILHRPMPYSMTASDPERRYARGPILLAVSLHLCSYSRTVFTFQCIEVQGDVHQA